VLDVLTERYSPNIGIRAYGKDPALVARYGAARIRGMAKAGLAACAKHFPGKGHSPLDAHLALPTIESTWPEMHAIHLVPFIEALAADIPCIMTSHPVYPNLDPTGVPATFSRLLVTDYLRGQLGFRGVIVSDDLEMGAVSQTCSVGEAAVRAAAAGHDLLLVCHTAPAQRAAAGALLEACRSATLPAREVELAAERVRRFRAARGPRFAEGSAESDRDGAALAMAIATRAVTVVKAGRPDFRRRLNDRVSVVFPRFSDLAPRITIEAEFMDEAAYVRRAFARIGVAAEPCVVGIEPTVPEIEAATKQAAAADATVLFLFDAHLYASNRALLEALQAQARGLAVVLLRDPYDADLLGAEVLGLTAYGFRRCQIEAVIARLGHP
jgi:beta-N-acetylhexosaminidase